jgi:hypothetical protein
MKRRRPKSLGSEGDLRVVNDTPSDPPFDDFDFEHVLMGVSAGGRSEEQLWFPLVSGESQIEKNSTSSIAPLHCPRSTLVDTSPPKDACAVHSNEDDVLVDEGGGLRGAPLPTRNPAKNSKNLALKNTQNPTRSSRRLGARVQKQGSTAEKDFNASEWFQQKALEWARAADPPTESILNAGSFSKQRGEVPFETGFGIEAAHFDRQAKEHFSQSERQEVGTVVKTAVLAVCEWAAEQKQGGTQSVLTVWETVREKHELQCQQQQQRWRQYQQLRYKQELQAGLAKQPQG